MERAPVVKSNGLRQLYETAKDVKAVKAKVDAWQQDPKAALQGVRSTAEREIAEAIVEAAPE